MMGAVPVASTPLVRRTRGRLSPRPKGSGGIVEVRPGVWRVDLEVGRDPVTGRRRRVSRRVRGSRVDAEAALAKLRVSADERRLPQRGTSARTVRAVLERYVADAESGVVELAPKTVVTTRSACSTISATVLDDGRVFGDLTLASLGWADIESLYRVMRATGQSAATVRRKATVLATALDRARKHGLIDHNPARDASRPKAVRSKPHSPGRDEVMAVLDRARVIDPEIADGRMSRWLLKSPRVVVPVVMRRSRCGQCGMGVSQSLCDGRERRRGRASGRARGRVGTGARLRAARRRTTVDACRRRRATA